MSSVLLSNAEGSLTTSAAIEPQRFVTINGSGLAAYPANTDTPVGVSRDRAASGGVVRYRHTNAPGWQQVSASKAIAINTVVYLATNGQITDSAAGSPTKIGISRTAAAAANDVIFVQTYLPA